VIAKAAHSLSVDLDVYEDAVTRIYAVIVRKRLAVVEPANTPAERMTKEESAELSVGIGADDAVAALFDKPWVSPGLSHLIEVA
jgi:hypothetical protein